MINLRLTDLMASLHFKHKNGTCCPFRHWAAVDIPEIVILPEIDDH